MRKHIQIACLLALTGCQPADLERRSDASVKSVADCIFARISVGRRWVREDLYSHGRVEMRLVDDGIRTIVVEDLGAGSRVTASFPVKATSKDRRFLEMVFDACGAPSAI